MKKTLYIKMEQCTEVNYEKVTIGDVAKLECSDSAVVNRLKTEKLLTMGGKNGKRCVVSVLLVIQKIHEIYPDLDVQNLGEADFIISYQTKKTPPAAEKLKVFFVCMTVFFGSMFSMMSFNEDVSALDSFRKVYTWVIGTPPQGVTILEIMYSIGVSVGIIVFFNHFGKSYLTDEPSPVEVEMSDYEQQINTTLILHRGREGKEKDVD